MTPTCAFGRPFLGATPAPPYHCAACQRFGRQLARQFEKEVRTAHFNRRGYTKREWTDAGHPASTWKDDDMTKGSRRHGG